jgi:hypothetical protein
MVDAATKNVLYEPRVQLRPDGMIDNLRFERLAMLIADGVDLIAAWKAPGCEGTTSQGSRRYGKKVLANKVFLARVKTLSDERAAFEADPVWGEAMWMVTQLYRTAIIGNDIRTMSEAVKLRVQIAEKRVVPGAAVEEAPTAPSAGPGRKAAESPQARSASADDIRERLMQKNREQDLEDAEPAGEA